MAPNVSAALESILPQELVLEVIRACPVWVLLLLVRSERYGAFARMCLIDRVDAHYENWGLHAGSTKTMMRRWKVVMSGMGALSVCDPASGEPEELDFLCPRSEVEGVRAWLEERDYTVVGDVESGSNMQELSRDDWVLEEGEEWQYWELPRVRYDCGFAKKRVLTLRREDIGKTVKVIQSVSELAAAPIFFFASTLTMNMVTGDGVVCMYPGPTSQGIGRLNYQLNPPLRDVEPETLQELLHYQRRGYSFRPGIDPSTAGLPVRRDWNDRMSVCMAFDDEYPITQPYKFDWNVGFRQYNNRGYTDVEPTCYIYQDAEEVVYENFLEKVVFTMDP